MVNCAMKSSQTKATMSKPNEDIFAPKPEARPRIYAYSIADAAHAGLLKVGQTTRDVKQRVAEQLRTAAIRNYTIELDEPAERHDGTLFSDLMCARRWSGRACRVRNWNGCGARSRM